MASPALLHGDLTKQGMELLRAIQTYIDEVGYPPTTRELAEIFGYASPSTPHLHLSKLRQIGAVTWVRDSPRTIAITPAGKAALED